MLIFMVMMSGCGPDHGTTMPPLTSGRGSDDSEAPHKDRLNQYPTGSIPTPSLCARVGEDVRVTQSLGTETFSFLWENDHYVVVLSSKNGGNYDIYIAKMSAQGQLLSMPQLLDASAEDSGLPSIARIDTGYVVAWEDGTERKTVKAHALDRDANPVGSVATIIATQSSQSRPVVSSSKMGTVIAWMDSDSAHVGLLDGALNLSVDVPSAKLGADESSYPWLADGDDSLGALWSDATNGRVSLHFVRLDDKLDPEGSVAALRDSDAINDAVLGRLIHTDFGYLSAWEDLRTGVENIYMAILDENGNKFAGGLVEEPDTGGANWPHMAWAGSSAGIAYYQFRLGGPQIFMTFIDPLGARVGGAADAQISNTPHGAEAKYPDVQWTGSAFGLLWTDTRDGHPELYFNQVVCQRSSPI